MSDAIDLLVAELRARRGLGDGKVLDEQTWGKPFQWRDPRDLPPRRWLYRPHLIRGFVSLTVAPGGAGKTALAITEALAVATGRPLLGVQPDERGIAWIWNGEDPADEMERRVHACMQYHGVQREELEGHLFLGSGREGDLVVAEQSRDGAVVLAPVVDALIDFVRSNGVSLITIDPFVACHRVQENDNSAIDRVVKTWARVAEATFCAVELIHHTRKSNAAEISVEDGRGAVALLAAARHARTMRGMSDKEAQALGVPTDERWAYVRLDNGKANLGPPARKATWMRLMGVRLPNGDDVQAAAVWTPPDPVDDLTPEVVQQILALVARGNEGRGWRASSLATDWAGFAIMECLGLDSSRASDKAQAGEVLDHLLSERALMRVKKYSPAKGRSSPFIEVGDFGLA